MRPKPVMCVASLFAILLAVSSCNVEYAFVRVNTVGESAFLFGEQSFRSDDFGVTWTCLDTPWMSRGDYAPQFERLALSLVEDRYLFVPDRDQLFISRDGGGSWTGLGITSGPAAGGIFKSIHFFEPDRGLAQILSRDFGDRWLLWTRDGGKSWSTIEGVQGILDADHDQRRVLFLDSARTIRQSLDRGETWEVLGDCRGGDLKSVNDCRSLKLVDGNLWLLGNDGFCRQMDLETQEVSSCGIQSKLWLFDVAARGQLLLIGASESTLLISEDGGTTWRTHEFGTRDLFVSVGFFSNGTAIAVGGKGEFAFPRPLRVAVASTDLRRWEHLSLPSCP